MQLAGLSECFPYPFLKNEKSALTFLGKNVSIVLMYYMGSISHLKCCFKNSRSVSLRSLSFCAAYEMFIEVPFKQVSAYCYLEILVLLVTLNKNKQHSVDSVVFHRALLIFVFLAHKAVSP